MERNPQRRQAIPELICIDVDGTLVTETQETPASARGTVRAPIAAGDRPLLSTGRPLPEIYLSLWDLGFHGTIAGSGTYVKIGEEVVMDRRISAEETSYVTDIYRGHSVS